MKDKTRQLTVACLPVAGPENPYQALMIGGLNEHAIQAYTGIDDRFLGILRTQLRFKPDYLHFDWIVSYYYRRWPVLTFLCVPLFLLQILFIHHFTSTQLVWTLHNLFPHDLPYRFIHRYCQRFLARRCRWIRVFSEETVTKAAAVLQVPSYRFHVVPEGDFTSVYRNETSANEARIQLAIPHSAVVLLFLGTIRPYKGISDLLRAVQQIDHPGLLLLIAGHIPDWRYGKRLKQELNSRCLLHAHFIANEQLQHYFNAADAVVLPFRKIENSGSALLAMGFEKPIIAPGKGVLRTRLSHQNQLLYDSESHLKEVIRTMISYSDEERRQIGKMNRIALQNHRWGDFGVLFQ
jgi:beta-1,4-mannosyltransferase